MEPKDGAEEAIVVAEESQPAPKKATIAARIEGRSLFPVSRMQKIIKADKELPLVAKEAVFAMSIAAEEFIKRLTVASQKQAERERRMTVQKKDIVVIVKRADEFFFLEDILEALEDHQVSRTKT